MLADLPAAITTDPFHAVMLERIDTGLYYGPLALGATELTMVRPLPSAWEDARHGASKLTTHTSVMETVTAAVAARQDTGLPVESFGIADSVDQFICRFPALLFDERALAVTFRPYRRDEQPAGGGWAWNTHGEYYGELPRLKEHLAHEPVIEEVVVFQIHELLPVPAVSRPHTFRS